jgi:hypothetical protein
VPAQLDGPVEDDLDPVRCAHVVILAAMPSACPSSSG